MKPFDEKLSDHIREQFDQYDEPFDHQAWQKLQARLGRKKRSRTLVVMQGLGRAAAAVLLLISLFFIYRNVFWMDDPVMIASHDISPMEAVSIVLPAVHGRKPIQYQTSFTHYLNEKLEGLLQAGKPIESDRKPTAGPQIAQLDALTPNINPAKKKHLFDKVFADLAKASVPGDFTPLTATQPLAKKDDDPGRSIHWSLFVGSNMTYAENQLASGIGLGAGVLTEYSLTSFLSISSGLILAHQHFSVDNLPLDSFTHPPEIQGMAFTKIEIFGDHTYKHYTADIPVNLKIGLLNRSRHKLFVYAGVSSLLFFGQTVEGMNTVYATDYFEVNGDLQFHSITQIDWFEITADLLDISSRFDLARMLNVSIAYESSIKGNSFTIEPFVKIPLAPVSAHQLKLGTGGINLRYHI